MLCCKCCIMSLWFWFWFWSFCTSDFDFDFKSLSDEWSLLLILNHFLGVWFWFWFEIISDLSQHCSSRIVFSYIPIEFGPTRNIAPFDPPTRKQYFVSCNGTWIESDNQLRKYCRSKFSKWEVCRRVVNIIYLHWCHTPVRYVRNVAREE